MNQFNDDQMSDIDPEGPDPSEMDPDDGPGLVKCPYCGKMISEDTEICHLCGSYISEEDSRTPVPGWIWIGVLLGLLGMLWWAIAFIWKGLS